MCSQIVDKTSGVPRNKNDAITSLKHIYSLPGIYLRLNSLSLLYVQHECMESI